MAVTSTHHGATLTTGAFALGVERRVSLLVYHREGVEAVPLSEGQALVIGRAPPADVRVDHPSLSRRHARFELKNGEVWIEDLGSTNKTLLEGQPVTRARVLPGQDLVIGAIVVSVHSLGPADVTLPSVLGHDRFMALLDEEVVRHRTFGRRLSLLMVVAGPRQELSHWCPRVRQALRQVDRLGLYGPRRLEVLLPETGPEAATALGRTLAAELGLTCGAATFPDDALSPEELVEAARTAAQGRAAAGPAAPVDPTVPAGGLVLCNAAMKQVFESVRRLAQAAIPVLITGETGSGKEIVARAIHELGARRERPLRTVNCAAIPAQLLESILFGHERGAFTGADRRTDGVFLEAHGGTVLLDEIGELSAAAQAALLRVLETKRVVRVGSTEETPVDVRVLGATNRNLEAMCEAGSFRWDLLYRINTMTLKVPPLRERQDEIEPLARRFLEEASRAGDTQVSAIAPEALELLLGHDWPGNVRELRNAIHRAVVLAQGSAIRPEDLPERVQARKTAATAETGDDGGDGESGDGGDELDFRDRVQRFETRLIARALAETGGNQAEAARRLRIPIRTLAYKLRAYRIPVSR